MLNLLINNASLYMAGIKTTVLLTLVSAIFGLLIAAILSCIYLSKAKYFKKVVQLYLFIIRGTPFLLQLFIIYYGSMQFGFIAHTALASIFKSAYSCALIALAINTSAYTTVFLTKTIEDMNKKELLAAKNLGLNWLQISKQIVLPQIMMKALPIYSNELIMLIKCTAITSSITIIDIMGATQQIIGMTYQTIPCLAIAAIIYLMLNLVIVVPSKFAYQKYCNKINI